MGLLTNLFERISRVYNNSRQYYTQARTSLAHSGNGLEQIVDAFSGFIDLKTGRYIGFNPRIRPYAEAAYNVYNKIETNEGEEMREFYQQVTNKEPSVHNHYLVGAKNLSTLGNGNAAAVNMWIPYLNRQNGEQGSLNITAIDLNQLLAFGEDHVLPYIYLIHEKFHELGEHTERAYELTRKYLITKSDSLRTAGNVELADAYQQMAQIALKMEEGYNGRSIALREGVASPAGAKSLKNRVGGALQEAKEKYHPRTPGSSYQPIPA